jgi:AcrR family transcriptional regulator
MSAVAREASAPSGSVYHRFADRPTLLAALWVRTLARFQVGALAAMQSDPPLSAAIAAARHVVEWSRRNPAEAQVLLAGVREFGVDEWSEGSRDSLRSVQAEFDAAVHSLVRRLGFTRSDRERVLIAVDDLPYATVRRHMLAGKPIPGHAADLVEQGVRALLDLVPTTTTSAATTGCGKHPRKTDPRDAASAKSTPHQRKFQPR